MPKSKNRKNHKKKLAARKTLIQHAKNAHKKQMNAYMSQILKMQNAQQDAALGKDTSGLIQTEESLNSLEGVETVTQEPEYAFYEEVKADEPQADNVTETEIQND